MLSAEIFDHGDNACGGRGRVPKPCEHPRPLRDEGGTEGGIEIEDRILGAISPAGAPACRLGVDIA